MALGINGVAAIAGSFLGLVIGGVLAPVNWNLIFLVSVPFGLVGTVWAYLKLHDTGVRRRARMDWWGNITFAVGLVAVLVGIAYGIQPHGDSATGWGSPFVLGCLLVLVAFVVIETKVDNPLFNLSLFRLRSFSWGNLANLAASLGRGGLQFILIISGPAEQVAALPAVAVLFAAFLGYNPMQQLLGDQLNTLPADQASFLTGRSFFPELISGPFAERLRIAFGFAIVLCVIGAIASLLCRPVKPGEDGESVGAELASTSLG